MCDQRDAAENQGIRLQVYQNDQIYIGTTKCW